MRPLLVILTLVAALAFVAPAGADTPAQGAYGEWATAPATVTASIASVATTEAPAPKRQLADPQAVHELQTRVLASGNLPMGDDWYAANDAMESSEGTQTR